MAFRFSTQKTIQAVGVLLEFERTNRMGRLRLLKLLYMADRESLKETGRPLVGSRVVAMKHGPLHSEVLDLIHGQHLAQAEWSKFIRNDGYQVELTQDPGRSTLSRYEIEKLTELSTRFAHREDWDVADVTHEFPEYRKNCEEGTSKTIPFRDILEAVGRAGDAESILQDAKDKTTFDDVFGV